jgi:hypothetical protein
MLLRTFLRGAATAALFAALPPLGTAQRHRGLSSPPTAPAASHAVTAAAPQTFIASGTGLGPIQFYPGNYGTVAPQSITRQLSSDDERTRQSALQGIGVPSLYTQRGHVPFPRSVQLALAPLSPGGDTDALLTVELDRHIVTAVLMPQNGDWKRVATVIFPTEAADPATTAGTFVQLTRSTTEPNRYRAVFRARETQPNGSYTENQAFLRIYNNHAIITTSFLSDARQCASAPNAKSPSSCKLTRRWLQPDTSQPGVHRFTLVTATGTLSGRDLANPMANSPTFAAAHLHNYACQPFTFSDASLRYEPAGPLGPCARKPGR